MSDPNYERVKRVLNEAWQLDPAARESYLDRECVGDEELREEVESLLAHADEGTSPLDDGLSAFAPGELAECGGLLSDEAMTLLESTGLPAAIGHFRIRRRMAVGGMGAVYEAEQDKPHRRVALKVLRSDMVSPALLLRFRRESEILGLLQHAGIAHIYEAGTTDDGLPYFAMEFIDGCSLIEFARTEGLGLAAKLTLFARVCAAVDYAHGKGVIHRDLKPDNILVTADGNPKVLDFGVARASGADLQAVTMATEAGQIMGTLAYMSPEQVSADPSLVDAASDVYSLGVVLFELLVGRRPHELAHLSLPEATRVIQEQDAIRPSSADTQFKGDIDTIVGKALEKEVGRRYGSAAELAADIHLFLAHEPIRARQPSSFYQVRKFARRHRGLVGGVGVAFLALAIAFFISVRFGLGAARDRDASRSGSYRISLTGAVPLLDAGQKDEALQLLQQAPADLRGWEWFHLQARLRTHLWEASVAPATADAGKEQRDAGRQVVFSEDGRRVLTAVDASSLGVWDTRLGAHLWTIPVGGDIGALAIGPGGVAVVAGGDLLTICDAGGGAVVHEERLPGPAVDVAWSRAGDRLAVALDLGKEAAPRGLVLVGPPGELSTVWETSQRLESLEWSPGDRQLLVLGHQLMFLDASSWAPRHSIVGHFTRLGSSPGAPFIAVATPSREVRLYSWDGAEGQPLRTLRGHQSREVTSVAMSRSGDVLASAATRTGVALQAGAPDVLKRGSLCVWEGPHFEEVERYELLGVPRVAVSSEGSFLALNSDGRLRVWSRAEQAVRVLEGPGSYVYSIAWHPDGRSLFARDYNGAYRMYDALDGRVLLEVPTRWEEIGSWMPPTTGWGLSVDGRELVALVSRFQDRSRADRGALVRMDVDAGQSLVLDAPSSSSAQSATEGVGRGSQVGRFWTVTGRLGDDEGKAPRERLAFARSNVSRPSLLLDPQGEWTLGERSWSMVPSDAARLGVNSLDKDFEPSLGSEPPHDSIYHRFAEACFSPDSARIVIARPALGVRVYDVRTTELIAELVGHSNQVFSASWSSDGMRIATGSNDNTIRIWHGETYELLAVLRGHSSYVKQVRWSPDGETLASASGDGTVRLWSTRSIAERTLLIKAAAEQREQQRAWVRELFEQLDDPHAVVAVVRAADHLDDDARHGALRVVREQANAWWAARDGVEARGGVPVEASSERGETGERK